jgi:hypothetical protein
MNALGMPGMTALFGGNWNNASNAGTFNWNLTIPRLNVNYNRNKNIHISMAPRPKFNITKETLTDLHLVQNLTPGQIADKFGCSHSLVLYYLKKYEIEKLPKYERLEGERFGKLLVKRFIEIRNNNAIWECLCDCGNIVTASTASLKFGMIRSCGCLIVELMTTHGMTRSRPYRIWQAMKTRCGNPNAINYAGYGGSGITYDPRWVDFAVFWSDMKEGYNDSLTIERIDNSKGYSKENCIWADYRTQNLNKTNNVRLSYKGRKITITEWAEVLHVDRKYLYYLHSRGLPDEQIIDPLMRKEVMRL